ncbi:MAG TPA: hypothetical protein VFR03_20450 [Thermoanaerobaculia bacterium]|nr:hypothetical protein [Thermoanaerobaculia bacterium]
MEFSGRLTAFPLGDLLPAAVDPLEQATERRGQPALQRWWRRVFQPAS